MFPTTFITVAGASITTAMVDNIPKADAGKPNILNIKASDITPPPVGTALIKNPANRETPKIDNIAGNVVNS